MTGAMGAWRRAAAVCLVALVALVPAVPAQPAVWSPLGLWRNDDDGMVMRLLECGASICSEIVGIPPAARADARAPKCREQLLRDLTWNANARRYEGTLSPPGSERRVRSSIEPDGPSRLVLKARMMMMSKTLRFTKFTGTPGADCTLAPAAP